MQLVQRGPHGHPQLGVQVGQRLVHQEGLRLADDGPAHRDPLPLPAGQRGRLALEVRLQAEHLGGLADPPLDLVLGRLAQLQAERQVLLDRHVRVQGVVLEHHGDVPVLGRQVVDHPVADRDRAAGDLLQPGDGPQRGRLAAPGGADEHHELAVRDVKAQLVNGLDAARVGLFHVIKDYLCHLGTSRAVWSGMSERRDRLVTWAFLRVRAVMGFHLRVQPAGHCVSHGRDAIQLQRAAVVCPPDGHRIGQFPDEASVRSAIPEGEHDPPPGAVSDQAAAIQRLVGNADSPGQVEGPERGLAGQAPDSPARSGFAALAGQLGGRGRKRPARDVPRPPRLAAPQGG